MSCASRRARLIRIDAQPRVEFSTDGGKVYVLYTDEEVDESGDTVLWLVSATIPSGNMTNLTFGNKKRVSTVANADGKTQFLPDLAVLPGAVSTAPDRIAVSYYESASRGKSEKNRRTTYQVAISDDGGAKWKSNVISGVSNEGTGLNAAKGVGAYSTMVYESGMLYAAWADNSGRRQGELVGVSVSPIIVDKKLALHVDSDSRFDFDEVTNLTNLKFNITASSGSTVILHRWKSWRGTPTDSPATASTADASSTCSTRAGSAT